jgi:hypothetical protein
MIANAIVFSQPVAKFFHGFPLPHSELTEYLAVLFTGPVAPTEADYKRTLAPLLVRQHRV